MWYLIEQKIIMKMIKTDKENRQEINIGPEEDEKKKREYGKNRYHTMSEEKNKN